MAVNRDTLRILEEMNAVIDEILAGATGDLARAFDQAWLQVRDQFEALALEIATASVGGQVTRTQLVRSERFQAGLAAFNQAITQALSGSVNQEALNRLLTLTDEFTVGMIRAQLTGSRRAELRNNLFRADPLQIIEAVQRTTEQITALHSPLIEEATQAVKREIIHAVTYGQNPRDAARRMVRGIEDRFNGGLARANTIARTEILDVHRRAAQQVEEQNTDVLGGWEWHASLDPKTCRACIAMHGTRHETTEQGPEGHQNCRCARVPVTKTWEELGFKGITEPASLTKDAEQWFEGLSEDDQRQLLGDAGFDAWLAGDYPIENWAKRRETDGWRDSYVPSSPPKSKS